MTPWHPIETAPKVTEWHSANIWCPACDNIRPCVRDVLDGGAFDLVCGHCHAIIATLHPPLPDPPVKEEK